MPHTPRNWLTNEVLTAPLMVDLEQRLAAYADSLVTDTSPRSSGMWVDFFRYAIDTTPSFPDYAVTAARFKTIMLQVWETGHAQALKAENPDITILGYQNFIYSTPHRNPADGDTGPHSTVLAREQADWLEANIGDSVYVMNGVDYVTNPFNGTDRLLDVGSVPVQTAMVQNMLVRINQAGFDGVFADDYNYNVADPKTTYADDDQWAYRALYPAAHAAGTALKAEGMLLVPNLGNAGEYNWVSDSFPFVSGYNDEFWMHYSDGTWNGYWWDSVLLADRALDLGRKIYLSTPGVSNTDWVSARLGLAMALMVTRPDDPSRVNYHFKGVDHTAERWDASTFELNIGAPTADREWTGTEGDSGLVRYFERGVAAVNPGYNTSGGQRVGSLVIPLDGGPYNGFGPNDEVLTNVTEVTLDAGEGVVLAT